MASQEQSNTFYGTNSGPFTPVSEVTDSYSYMSMSDNRDDGPGIQNRTGQSNGSQSLHRQGNILEYAVRSAQTPHERFYQSTVLASGQQISHQPTHEPQITITNQPLPNDFKFRQVLIT